MKVTSTDFKTFCDNFLVNVKNNKEKANGLCDLACKEFGISSSGFNKRFKSYYGMTVSSKVSQLLEPTREYLVKAILAAEDVTELWEKLNLSVYRRSGLFDKHFKVSTFEKAKALCLLETFKNDYNPSIDENRSLVASQILGDGSYNSYRGALNISHGEKQIDYVYYKASLFNKAFPETKPAGNTKICKHTQGHIYASWWSGRLPSKITTWADSTTKAEMVKSLTPFGMFLWFIDDGYMNLNFVDKGNNYFQIYVHDSEALESLVEELMSYGITSTTSKNSLKIGRMDSAVMFYKCFIEPFKHLVPECLNYKTEMKI